MTWTLRAALPDEAETLVALLLRSKAVWGYDAAFMAETRRQALRAITPDTIATHPVYVAESEGELAGFYCLCDRADEPRAAEIDWLFVEPIFIGRGVGRALVLHGIETARALAYTALVVESDQHAEGFYAALGMTRCGEQESSVVPGRMNPVLRFELKPF